MSYCVAWKKDKKVYMIGDSASSALQDDIRADTNTFGEVQGLYGKYIVQEGILKLYTVAENIVISYSGDKDTALEVIGYFQNMINNISNIENIFEAIESTYGNSKNINLELIIAVSFGQDDNRIYHFNGNVIEEVLDFVDIGSGKDCSQLTSAVKWAIGCLYEQCKYKFDYLASIVSFIQCFTIKNKLYKYGVGGVFFGVVVDTKVRWCRDLAYYLYDENALNPKTISVMARDNSIFSSTDIDGGIRFILNEITDLKFWNSPYYKKSIVKAINTKNPIYFLFYSTVYNHVIFVKVDGWMHTSLFRRWIRREDEKIQYGYAFDAQFQNFLEREQEFNDENPTFTFVSCKQEEYISHEEMWKYVKNNTHENFKKKFDCEFSLLENSESGRSLFKLISKDILEYKNVILVDYSFLCEIIEEKINMYSCEYVLINNLDLKELVHKFMITIASKDFNDYKIVVVKDKDYDKIINGMSMDEWFKGYKNCTILESDCDNYLYDLSSIMLELIKNYYINDTFFHLDKLIFVLDNNLANDILKIAPENNFEMTSPDIILVRNLNDLTNMDGRFRYVVIDYLVGYMFGLDNNEIGLLESGFPITR